MAVRAVAFDIGGVLERVEAPDRWLGGWRERLGIDAAEFRAALAIVDPGDIIKTGGLSETRYRRRYAAALGLSRAQAEEFMAGMWDWYCGEPGRRAGRFRRGAAAAVFDGPAE